LWLLFLERLLRFILSPNPTAFE